MVNITHVDEKKPPDEQTALQLVICFGYLRKHE